MIIQNIINTAPEEQRSEIIEPLNSLIEGISDTKQISKILREVNKLNPIVIKYASVYLQDISDADLISDILKATHYIPPQEIESFFITLKSLDSIPIEEPNILEQVFFANPDPTISCLSLRLHSDI